MYCSWHKLGQTQGDGEGQGNLACCSPWGRKELDMTERLNWTCFILSHRSCMLYFFGLSFCYSDRVISIILFSRPLKHSLVTFIWLFFASRLPFISAVEFSIIDYFIFILPVPFYCVCTSIDTFLKNILYWYRHNRLVFKSISVSYS